jgi:hypothetical protein
MNIVEIISLAIIVIIVMLMVGLAGFRFRPKVKLPSRQSVGEVPTVLMPVDLPPLLQRSLEANFGSQLPASRSLVAWGRGRIVAGNIPILGHVWTSLLWTLNLTPGQDFVLDTRLSWFGRIFAVGTEELRHGHGRFNLGERVIENANLDLSETTLLWIYTAWLSPFSLLANPHISWKIEGDSTICASVPFVDGAEHTFDLIVDPQNFHFEQLDTTRVTSKEGNSLPFHAVFSQHHSFDNDFIFPAHLYFHWDTEDAYMHLDLSGVRYNVDLSDLMQAES